MPINDLIYDVGMNNGDDTAYYLSLGFRTVAIEANPELVKYAKARFAREIASRRLIILNIGIADQEGELPFWICETNSRWSSFDRAYASWGSTDAVPPSSGATQARACRDVAQQSKISPSGLSQTRRARLAAKTTSKHAPLP